MALTDNCVTIIPHFIVKEGELDAFKAWCAKLEKVVATEEKCLFFGFSFDGDKVYCLEGYEGAQGVLEHLEVAGPHFEEGFSKVDVQKIDFHGPAAELEKLKANIEGLGASAYTLEFGFRK